MMSGLGLGVRVKGKEYKTYELELGGGEDVGGSIIEEMVRVFCLLFYMCV